MESVLAWIWQHAGHGAGSALCADAEELDAARADVRSAIAAAAERYRNGNPDSAEFDLAPPEEQ